MATSQPDLQLSSQEARDRKKVEYALPPPQIRKPQGEVHMDVGIPSRRMVARSRHKTIQFGQVSKRTDLEHLQEQIELGVTYMIH